MAKKTESEEVGKAAKRAKDALSGSARPPSSKRGLLQGPKCVAFLICSLLALVAALLVPRVWPRQIKVLQVERVPLRAMDMKRFLSEFSTVKPLVLTGAWPEVGWRPAELVAKCKHAQIRTFRHDDTATSWARHVQVGVSALSAYFAENFAPARHNRPKPILYGFEMELAKHCPEQLEAVTVPAFFTEDAFHLVTNRTGLGWPSVLLGPEGSVTGLHIDTHRLPFWIAVVAPESFGNRPVKRLRIFPHNDTNLLKYAKSAKTGNLHFEFDPWTPDYSRYPGVADGHVFEAELRSGDILYIPGGSPHAAINVADNLGVSMNYLDLKSMLDFVRNCGPGSPLCGVLAGKGEWVMSALEERRRLGRHLSYWEFAGIKDRADFCRVHKNGVDPLKKTTAPDGQLPALDAYCL